MDSKKFMQLVEEKKKQALDKKEAPLKWEQKLEAAAKAKADAEAKEGKLGAAKHKQKFVSDSSDSKSDGESSDGRKKTIKRTHKKHRRHGHFDSSLDDCEKRRRRNHQSEDQRSDPHLLTMIVAVMDTIVMIGKSIEPIRGDIINTGFQNPTLVALQVMWMR